ncbi:MAG: ABC transporter ATP-binding protein [Deltaproteobacteria bacterium]|nr:ABC transporter ATP-binding protein [Deltaproteobacteria bacterium]
MTANAPSSPILSGENIQVQRGGKRILDVSSLKIVPGEVLSLIGPNGAGKTTLLQALSQLIRLGKGDIYFQGKKVGADMAPLDYRRCLAMVFQEALLFDTTVYGNVASGLKIRGVKSSEIVSIVNTRLEQFGIGHLRDRSAKTLSGGEAQRTSLARAFAIQPQLLFLDEPFAALDPPTREALLEDLNRVLRASGTTAIMATHDQVEALRLSDRIAVMNEGRIVQIGPPAEVMNHPVDEFIASFVGMETIFEGKVVNCERGTATIAVSSRSAYPAADALPTSMTNTPSSMAEASGLDVDGLIIEVAGQAKVGEQILCCIRPEHVTLSPGVRTDRSSARNAFPSVITRISPAGAFYKVHLNGGFPLVAYVTVQSIEDLDLRVGATFTASFKATAVHMIRRG